MKIAVQLYSVRDHIQNGDDLLKVLGEVKALGYEGVEFAGYFGLEPEVIKARLDELGLTAVGTHIGVDDYLPENIDKTIATAKTLGMKNSGVGGGPIGTPEELMATAGKMGYGFVKAAKEGITVYFHNHTREFEEVGGIQPVDLLKNVCALEVDTYWSFCAGVDNYKFITENKDKICLLHVKDGVDHHPCALGEGQCDVAAVVKAAKDNGIEWLVVENDDPTPNGLDDIGRSIKYLKTLIG
ncbi:MAG TPA: hypothetical protein DDY98_01855 [Ruminococcaceae bacterium]|nr:hypothetical protein [Oscillospiraceae bacterium]